MYSIDDYNYDLPKHLISQKPISKRGSSKMLRMQRESGFVSHHFFEEIDQFLKPSDILVVNDTKVIPGKILGKKKSGGKVEVIVLNFSEYSECISSNSDIFQCLIKASRYSIPGTILLFEFGLKGVILSFSNGVYCIEFSNAKLLKKVIYKFGRLPLPPYIKRKCDQENQKDEVRYQTVYASRSGAIAAPTAGLHITKKIIERLKKIGVKIVKITLHIGYGTFSPVRVNDIRSHKMHSEWFSVDYNAAKIINDGKKEGQRIIAVGTTSVRTLEFVANKSGKICETNGYCDLFIYPGYDFKIVDAMITNFHLPRSTLLMLVSAFSSKEKILNAYKVAINEQYKFFSYGDAMLID